MTVVTTITIHRLPEVGGDVKFSISSNLHPIIPKDADSMKLVIAEEEAYFSELEKTIRDHCCGDGEFLCEAPIELSVESSTASYDMVLPSFYGEHGLKALMGYIRFRLSSGLIKTEQVFQPVNILQSCVTAGNLSPITYPTDLSPECDIEDIKNALINITYPTELLFECDIEDIKNALIDYCVEQGCTRKDVQKQMIRNLAYSLPKYLKERYPDDRIKQAYIAIKIAQGYNIE